MAFSVSAMHHTSHKVWSKRKRLFDCVAEILTCFVHKLTSTPSNTFWDKEECQLQALPYHLTSAPDRLTPLKLRKAERKPGSQMLLESSEKRQG